MNKQIAVLLNCSGQTETINEASIIKVYSKEKDYWKVSNEFSFTLKNLTTVKSIRETMSNLIKTLNNCKVIVAKELSGIPHTVLDMSGFTVIEVEGIPADFLDNVLESIEDNKLSKILSIKEDETNTSPVPMNNDGHYYMNLKELQNKNLGVTSKQALLPFLHNTSFYELIIICSHLPNWLEGELKKLNMKSVITMVNSNEYKILVYKKNCDEH